MGVPKFYRWTSERYPCLSEVINESQIPEFDNLYLDMNGIIHNCSHPNDDDIHFRIPEEEILLNIFTYIENLYNLIRPQKVFFMAVDGVAPRAKMNQQRARRFMTARTSAMQLRQALEKGEQVSSEKRFDSNCITPGTYFMTKLHERLDQWIAKKSGTDPRWRGRKIILSGHNCPGEGEHKIMDFIRTERAQPGYDPNTRHCMYGLDADLIMLGIVSHEPHFSLLREEVTFNVRPRKNEKAKKPQRTDSQEKKFHLLHLSLLREYLAWEFSSIKDSLPFAYDMERIVDDWILMGLLVGNDFLPHLPNLHIHDDALPLLYSTYKTVLPKLDGYINEGGYLNLGRFEKFLIELSLKDKDSFMNKMEDEQFLESKKLPRGNSQKALKGADEEGNKDEDEELVAFESSDIEQDDEEEPGDGNEDDQDDVDAAFVSDDEEEFGDPEEEPSPDEDDSSSQTDDALLNEEFNDELATLLLSGMDDKEFANNVEACWTKTVNNQFKRHKKFYYSDKMRYKNISKQELREQAEGYVRAIQWNLHYYFHGCVSWSWFYPHHYAPFISDIRGFSDMKIEFELSAPFRPFEQLLAVLPEASADCLPRPLQELMTSDPAKSPIHDFYPANFDTDLNGKKNDWEAVVLIPFIEEKRLLEAIESKESRLSAEEKARNAHGPHIQVISHRNSEDKWPVTRTLIDGDTFRIPRESVKWGLLPNVKMDVYFPGFPTMKHLKHTGALNAASVNVFGQASRKDSMVLTVEFSDELQKTDIAVLGGEWCEQEVCVDWPILKLAKIESIWADEKIVRVCPDEGDIIVKDMTDEEKTQYASAALQLQSQLMTRYAIEVAVKKNEKGKTVRPAIAWVRHFTGNVYETVTEKEGGAPILKAVKQWSNEKATRPVLLPLVVKDLLLENSRLLSDLPIEQAFPKSSVVWLTRTSHALYGHPAMVTGYKNLGKANCTIEVVGMVQEQKILKLEELRKKQDQKSLRWMSGYHAAQNCNTDNRLFARITGTIFMWNEPRSVVEKGHQISSESKLNCGLALKFSRRELCTADYTDRVESKNRNGQPLNAWFYSNLTCRLVSEYKKKFPEVFQHLQKAQTQTMDDVYYADEIWPVEKKRAERFAELREFLDSLPSRDAEQFKCGTQYADRQLITEVEKIFDVASKKESELTPEEKEEKRLHPAHMVKLWTPPSGLFRYELYDGKVLFDPEADFHVLDRVSCMSSHTKKPKTVQGVVVGLHDDKVDVLFDEAFDGGSHVRGSKRASAFRVPKSSLLNVTFGLIRKKALSETQKKQELLDKTYVSIPPKKTPVETEKPKQQKVDKPSTSSAPPTASTSSTSQKTSKSKNAEKKQKQKEKAKLGKRSSQETDSEEHSTEKLTNELNKLLKISRPAGQPSSTSTVSVDLSGPSTSASTSSHGQPGKKVSLMEMLGGADKKEKPIKAQTEEEILSKNRQNPPEEKKNTLLDMLREAQRKDVLKPASKGGKQQQPQQQQKKKEQKTSESEKSSSTSSKKTGKKQEDPKEKTLPRGAPAATQVPFLNPLQPPPPPPPHPMVMGPSPGGYPVGPPPGAWMGLPPLQQMSFQQQLPQFTGAANPRAPLTLTDLKPSSTTRRNRRQNYTPKVTVIRRPADLEQGEVAAVPEKTTSPPPAAPVESLTSSAPEVPSASESSDAVASSTQSTERKPRKPKKSRVAINFNKKE